MEDSARSGSSDDLGPYNYSLDAEVFAEAMTKMFWVSIGRPPWKWMYILIAAAFAALIGADLADGRLNVASTFIALFTVPAIVGFLRWQAGWSARRMFVRTPDLREENSLVVSNDTLHFSSNTSAKEQPIADLNGWIETPSLLLFDRPDQKAYIVPKEALGSDLEDVRQRLAGAGAARL